MEDESDGSLFTYLDFIETDPFEANAALHELMRRYEAILRHRCDRLCSRFPSLEIDGDELTVQAFWKATQRASTYIPLDKAEATTEEHIRYTSAWLFTIAQRLLFDAGREIDRPLPFEREISEPSALSSTDVAALLVHSNPCRFEPSDKPLVAHAFNSLKEEWQIVVIWTLDKRQRSLQGTYMNRGSATELAKRLKTTTANVRQMRKRAFDAIGKAVDQAKHNRRGR